MRLIRGSALALVALIGLTGCGDLVSAIQDGIRQAAIDAVLAEVQQQGGTALVVKAGEEATVAVSDATSPIYGTKLVLPADALPLGVNEAIVSMANLPGFVTNDPAWLLEGPGVDIQVRALPSLQPVTLATDATVFLPYFEDVTDTAGLVLGHLGQSGWEVLGGQELHEDGTLSGLTRSFSPFAVLRAAPDTPTEPTDPVDPGDGNNGGTQSFTYKVTDTTGVLCEGEIASPPAPVGATFRYYYITGGNYINYAFYTDDVRVSLELYGQQNTTAVSTEKTITAYDSILHDYSSVNFEVKCTPEGGAETSYAEVGDWSALMKVGQRTVSDSGYYSCTATLNPDFCDYEKGLANVNITVNYAATNDAWVSLSGPLRSVWTESETPRWD